MTEECNRAADSLNTCVHPPRFVQSIDAVNVKVAKSVAKSLLDDGAAYEHKRQFADLFQDLEAVHGFLPGLAKAHGGSSIRTKLKVA